MNEYDQSKVAYENGPKEVPTGKGLPDSKQFPGNKMPQVNKTSSKNRASEYIEKSYPANPSLNRYTEHR